MLPTLTTLFAILLISLLIYWRSDRETVSAADFRVDSGYQVASMEHGFTAYQSFGPNEGQAVIIVHGGTLGSMAYQDYVPPLVKDGLRVIIYDQYGRGFSDRPKNKLTIDLLRVQLLGLLNHLRIEKAHLFGISLGSALCRRARRPPPFARLSSARYKGRPADPSSDSHTTSLNRRIFFAYGRDSRHHSPRRELRRGKRGSKSREEAFHQPV